MKSPTMKPSAPIPPSKETPATLSDILAAQAALAALLAEETDLMKTMKIQQVGTLQDRKLKLTGMLERYLRYAHQHPEVLTSANPQEKAQARQAGAQFKQILKHNYDTLLVARAVNKSVVTCVTGLISRRQSNPVYTARGATQQERRPIPISVTLNEMV